MAAVKYKLKLEQGATLRKPFRWTAGPAGAKVPVDLTGWAGRMQIRPEIESEIVLVNMTTENGGIIMEDPENGLFILYLSDTEMSALTFESAVFDLELVAPNGDVFRLMKGTVSLDREVTRPIVVI